MNPRIETLAPKKLAGTFLEMSLVDNKTFELFSSFMPLKKHIPNAISDDVIEVLVYDDSYFENFSPTNSFIKWVAVEVSAFRDIPDRMKTRTLESGLYAVFNYKGLVEDFGPFMGAIFTEWLPCSEYQLDQRAHFNVLGSKYKNYDPDSEEEVWIPIKVK